MNEENRNTVEESVKAPEEKKDNRKKGLIIVIIILAVVLAGAIVFVITGLNKNQSKPVAGVGYDPNASMQTEEEIEAETYEDGYNPAMSVALPGWLDIEIAANQTEIKKGINFFNPKINEGYYDLMFTLQVDVNKDGKFDEETETLFESGLVPAGYTIREIVMSQALEKGEYDAVVFIQPYPAGETETALNNGKAAIKLYAE